MTLTSILPQFHPIDAIFPATFVSIPAARRKLLTLKVNYGELLFNTLQSNPHLYYPSISLARYVDLFRGSHFFPLNSAFYPPNIHNIPFKFSPTIVFLYYYQPIAVFIACGTKIIPLNFPYCLHPHCRWDSSPYPILILSPHYIPPSPITCTAIISAMDHTPLSKVTFYRLVLRTHSTQLYHYY